MARTGLPKKYAKMGFKKGWREYKKAKGRTRAKPRTKTRTVYKTRTRKVQTKGRRKSMRKGKLITKPFVDGVISGGGKVVMRKVMGSNPVYEAGFDILLGYFRNNKTLMAQGIVNGATAFLPSMNLLGGQGQEPWVGQ